MSLSAFDVRPQCLPKMNGHYAPRRMETLGRRWDYTNEWYTATTFNIIKENDRAIPIMMDKFSTEKFERDYTLIHIVLEHNFRKEDIHRITCHVHEFWNHFIPLILIPPP